MAPVPSFSEEKYYQMEIGFDQNVTKEQTDSYRTTLAEIQKSPKVCALPEKTGPRIFSGPAGVQKMTEEMLALVHQMHKQLLTDKSFVQHIASMIVYDYDDVKNPIVEPYEWGGIGIFHNNTIELLPVPYKGKFRFKGDSLVSTGPQLSLSSKKQEPVPNESYILPDWAKRIQHLLQFHIHTDPFKKHGDDLCKPSYMHLEKDELRGEDELHNLDLGMAINSAIRGVPHNHIIFSRLSEKEFGVVYYGSDIDENDNWYVIIISLENVTYFN